MLKKRTLTKALSIVALTLSIAPGAQAQNPIISSAFSADPTARVFDGKIYLYPSHDIPPVKLPTQRPDWFCMGDYHVYSSKDLTRWTDHGVILDQKDVPWGNPTAYSMWAPDCVKGDDGRYYFYFPDAPKEGRGFGVGVAVSDTPYGPFKAEPKSIEGLRGIDPCVMKGNDGHWYIYWAGGAIFQARLKDNMVELDSQPQRVEGIPQGFVEGPFAFERNGMYYLTFPWVRKENGTETLAYSTSDNPLGPWTFRGIIMEESPTGCWTNHHSIVKYDVDGTNSNQWYLFYHHNDYSPKFDKNRSVRADSISFNADGTIIPVKPTLRGIGITDSRTMIQMDRYSRASEGATVAYNDTINPRQGWRVRLAPKAWVSYGNVRLVEQDYKVWISTPGMFGRTQLTTIDKTTLKLDVNKQPNGYYELVLRNEGQTPVEVDWISLSKRQPLTPATRGGLESGSYRNLFLEAGYSQEEIDKKLQSVFDDVFKGKNRCYFEVGKDMAYISDVKNDDVRTEGMSYGLMIAVQWNKKDIFDRLWRWTKKYMQIQEGNMKGYFRWSCKRNGDSNPMTGPASDGELYFITSLIFASNQWGNEGEINYLAEAQAILDAIQPKEVEMQVRWENGKRLDTPKTVKRTLSLIDPETKLITFVPGANYTDPSYHIPAFYEVWARYADDGRASFWRECAAKSREYLHKSIHPMTGLNPDYNNYDGTLMGSRGIIGDAFRYDSWRVPMNIALDYSWSCSDRQWQQEYGNKIQDFLYAQGIDSFVDQYNVDGTTPNRILKAGNYPEKLRHSIGLVATSAAASIMCSHPESYEFIDRLWNAQHVADKDGYIDVYYDGLLRLFAFMHLSGRYRVIEKQMQLPSYLVPVEKNAAPATPDEQGFLRRWTLLEPIEKPNQSNTVFVDSYLREAFTAIPQGASGVKVPRDGQKEKVGKQTLTWREYDSKLYNVKLYRLASCQGLRRYGVVFWATTVIECDEDIEDVRLSVGSNSASMWWLNGEEVLLLSGDRRMVKDDGQSKRIKLHKGRNVLRGAVINGPGMSDFCVRLLDENGKPVVNNIKLK